VTALSCAVIVRVRSLPALDIMGFLAEIAPSERETGEARVSTSLSARQALLAALLLTALLSIPFFEVLRDPDSPGQRPGLIVTQGDPLEPSSNHRLTDLRKGPSSARLAEDTEGLAFPNIMELEPRTQVQRHKDRFELRAPASPDRGHQTTSVASTTRGSETELRQASDVGAAPSPSGSVGWVEQAKGSTSAFTLKKQRDWQISSTGFDRVEDKKMTYGAPDSGVRMTVREAASGFGTNFLSNSTGLDNYLTSGPLGLSPADGIAQSQKIHGTLIDLKDFNLSTFAYHSEVGRHFEAFGRAKKEFKTVGTRRMKAGANMKMGAFGFGLAQSITEDTYGSADAAFKSEASASIDLPRLMQAAKVPGDLTPKLIPTVWMNASTTSSASGQEGEGINLGVGGTWSWDMGYASLGYWSSSLGDSSGLGATWSGQGFDANVGAYYKAFAVDLGLSYGQSEDALQSWQSISDVYNYSATVAYNADKLPGISLTAAMGNYDQSSISFGSTFSESYALSSGSDYISLSAGLDLTSLFWTSEGAEDQPSVKMLYRHNESVFSDSYSDTKDVDDLFAVTIRRNF